MSITNKVSSDTLHSVMPTAEREKKNLRDHNTPGMKEVSMRLGKNGDMIGTTPKKQKMATAVVTPTKMKRVARERGKDLGNSDDIMFRTERLGPNGDFLVVTALKRDKSSVFLKPILDSIKGGKNGTENKLVNPKVFDRCLGDPRHCCIRKSRMLNEKVRIENKDLFHIGVISCPNKDNFKKELMEDEFHLEKMFANECEKILKEHDMRTKRKTTQVFVPWKHAHSQTDVNRGFRPLDHVLLDDTVARVIGIHFLDKDNNNTQGICGMLKADGVQDFFFSKHPHTNKHSKLAVENFGCPDNQ